MDESEFRITGCAAPPANSRWQASNSRLVRARVPLAPRGLRETGHFCDRNPLQAMRQPHSAPKATK
jgi:hypothetical protein